ncbi:MAG TPA: hypothetical protein VF720_09640 [Candidatus Eisenbacteria bacterium]
MSAWLSRSSVLTVMLSCLALAGGVGDSFGAVKPKTRHAQLDSLRQAAEAAQRAVIEAERQAVEAETIVVATRRPSRTMSVDLGRHGKMTVNTDQSHGDKVLMGDDLVVEADEVIGGDAVSMGGNITVLGKVMGSVVSVGGDVTLGDSSFVGKDAVSVGGEVIRSETAIVGREVMEVDGPAIFKPRFGGRSHDDDARDSSFGHRFAGLVQTVIFFLVLFAFAALALYLVRQRIEYASDYLSREPIPALLLGLVSPFLLLVSFVLLCITLIGIPVALALLVLYPVFIFVGWVVTGHRIGRSVAAGETPLRTVFAGLMVLAGLPLLFAFLRMVGITGFLPGIVIFTGIMISSLGAFIGLGAILGTRFRRGPAGPTAPPDMVITSAPSAPPPAPPPPSMTPPPAIS